jgi:hypothetical protein
VGVVREDGWDLGVRVGAFRNEYGYFTEDQAGGFPGGYYAVDSYLLGAVVGRTLPQTDRWANRVQGEAWTLFDAPDGIYSLGFRAIGGRAGVSTGYRVGYEGFSLTPTIGAYAQAEHRFGSPFATWDQRDLFGQPAYSAAPAGTDLEVGLRAALPLLFKIGGVPLSLVPTLEAGIGSYTIGPRVRGGLGLQVDF